MCVCVCGVCVCESGCVCVCGVCESGCECVCVSVCVWGEGGGRLIHVLPFRTTFGPSLYDPHIMFLVLGQSM